jgi:hypothetical protein
MEEVENLSLCEYHLRDKEEENPTCLRREDGRPRCRGRGWSLCWSWGSDRCLLWSPRRWRPSCSLHVQDAMVPPCQHVIMTGWQQGITGHYNDLFVLEKTTSYYVQSSISKPNDYFVLPVCLETRKSSPHPYWWFLLFFKKSGLCK